MNKILLRVAHAASSTDVASRTRASLSAAPRGIAALSLAWFALLPSCGQDPVERSAPTAQVPALDHVLVETSWLLERSQDPDLVVLDARPLEDYLAGHVPGAVSLRPGDLLDPSPDNARDMAPIAFVQQALGNSGVDIGRTVVVYDAGGDYRAAARVFWVLEVHGHPAVGVLNGGYRQWLEDGGQPSTDRPRPSPRPFVASFRSERLATMLGVRRAIEADDVIIVDARSTDEYAGRKSKAQRMGHIPGAVHVDFANNLDTSGDGSCEIKQLEGLLAVYGALDPESRVVTYCNSGNRASVSYLALRAIGRDAAVYDGSWLEWGNDPDLPIEFGSATRH
jgi:thiosulfate/3-mercaptopyruvate sulfurtransferase